MMKKPILFAALLCISTLSFSQINKGQWLVGGNLSFNQETNSIPNVYRHKLVTINVPINIGYFVADKLAIGTRSSFSTITDKYEYKDMGEWRYPRKTVSTTFATGVFARYYILPATSRFNFIVDGSYTFGRHEGSFTFVNPNNTIQYARNSGNVNSYQLAAGPSFFLNQYVSFEFLVGYRHTDYLKNRDINNNTFFSGAGLQIHLGQGKSKKTKP